MSCSSNSLAILEILRDTVSLDKGITSSRFACSPPITLDPMSLAACSNYDSSSVSSLTINKYLEEFPGLVHFLYIDRTNHRVTAPSLDFSSEETMSLTKKKIWSMVDFSRSHLQEGHMAIMWKDTTFNYAYFLWFEDASIAYWILLFVAVLAALQGVKQAALLGWLQMRLAICRKLIETCFPKTSPSKVRCYELYCIHLGLATSSCVLEHSRRLAATIWEVTGVANNPLDIL
uniref:FUZ/MON1/HPS1 third Longin domain-containing protein n=1 Tax=Timema douglasi TaxID=61478 RepID=A0A7R8ZB43_TIMDO|nr:unnamed protein product [Timema douglasi]